MEDVIDIALSPGRSVDRILEGFRTEKRAWHRGFYLNLLFDDQQHSNVVSIVKAEKVDQEFFGRLWIEEVSSAPHEYEAFTGRYGKLGTGVTVLCLQEDPVWLCLLKFVVKGG